MKRIKDNSYDIVVLIINQIGISIFALVLYTSMGFIGESSKELIGRFYIRKPGNSAQTIKSRSIRESLKAESTEVGYYRSLQVCRT